VPDYETWVLHCEQHNAVAAEEEVNDWADTDRMDEILEAIQPEYDLDTEDLATLEVEEFFRLLKASEERLHEQMKVTLLAFVTRLLVSPSFSSSTIATTSF
jgi:hypothetical protein